jgi:hypothetical protein
LCGNWLNFARICSLTGMEKISRKERLAQRIF